MTETILVIAAHPDDEILGLGATIARHADDGDAVHTIIAAEGSTSRSLQRDTASHAKQLGHLHEAAMTAARILGSHPPRMLNFPDNRLDSLDFLDIVKPIEAIVSELRPNIVYTHHAGDLNIDHRILYEAVLTACRPLPGASIRAIYTFETASSTEWSPSQPFIPNHYVDAQRTWDRKIAALEAYATEMRPAPHARSVEAIEALAVWRGASVGLGKAEAFQTVRQIRC